MIGIAQLVSTGVTAVAGVFTKRAETQRVKEELKGKIAAAKVAGDSEIALKRAEWENLAVKGTEDSWKDEYVTLIVTSPLLIIILGAIVAAFTGDTRLLDAATDALTRLQYLGIDMGQLMLWVVLAAIGIRGVNKLR